MASDKELTEEVRKQVRDFNLANPVGIETKPKIEGVQPQSDWLKDIGYYDDIAEQKLRVLVYGPMGAGKTRFAASFPKPVFIDTDKGGLTLRKAHVPFIPCYESKGLLKRVFSIIDAALTRTGPFAKGGEFGDRETIVLDSASVFSNSSLVDLIGQTGKDPLSTKASFDEYGRILNAQIELGKRFKRLSGAFNVVVTALVDVNKDEMTGAMYGGPLLVGQYRQLIGADFDEVYYMTTEGNKDALKHVLYSAKTSIYDAKTRLSIPYRIEDPNASKIIAGL